MKTRKIWITLITAILLCVFCAQICCAETKQLTTTFNGTGSAADPEMTFSVSMDDSWFSAPSAGYSHDLARLSLGMAGAAFRSSDPASANDLDVHIRDFFAEAGFTDYEQCQYDVKPTIETIGTAMAMKEIADGDETYTLIAIAVSGAGYKDEWLSNFTIEDGNTHAGFTHATELVLERFNEYRNKYAPEGRVKVWVSGYSRASAVSNLTAYNLIAQDNGIDPDDVFAYCFAVPQCTRNPEPLPQINNICGAFDPVPMIPPSEWGYGRHGVTRYITAAELDPTYEQKSLTAAEFYLEQTGRTDFESSQEANWLLHKVLEVICSVIPNASCYTEDYQSAIRAAWTYDGTMMERLELLIDEVDKATAANGEYESGGDLSDLFVLIEQCIYNSMMETYGVEETNLTKVLTSGIGLAHEHFPGVYMTWLLALDEGALFDHANYGSRLSITNTSSELPVTIENLTTGETTVLSYDGSFEETDNKLSAIYVGSEYMLALPGDSDYRVSLAVFPNSEIQLALTSFTCGMVSVDSIATRGFRTGDAIEISIDVMADGTASAHYGDNTYPFESDVLDGSSMQELKLAGNSSAYLINSIASDALFDTAPHVLELVLLILGLILLGIAKLIRRKQMVNERFTNENLIIRILFYLAAVACLFQLQLHFRYIAATLTVFRGNSNMIQRALGSMLKYSSLVSEIADSICFAMLAWLCIRAPIRKRSLKRCRHMTYIMILPELILMIVEMINDVEDYYTVVSVLTVLTICILTIVAGARRRRIRKREKAAEQVSAA